MRIQAVVADQRGLDVRSLVRAIESCYRTPAGRRVRIKVGKGEYVDGVPFGVLRIVDRDGPDPMEEET